MILRDRIELFYPQDISKIDRQQALQTFNELKFFLNNGEVRSASPADGNHAIGWVVNEWVKKGILLGFRLGEMKDVSLDEHFRFFDKTTLTLKKVTEDSGVRIVPGGTSIRDGAYLAQGTIVMPPAYINIGSYVDEGTMIDSHALVGSCAQIGKRVHLSAASQIGGVLEPIGALPVIIEDNVFIGGNCGIYEGTVVKKNVVIATGVHITRSTPVYDLVNNTIIRSSKELPIIIPEGAVVIPGSRAIDQPFAKQNHLSAYTPLIVKYRDASTDAATVLEASLR
ncbi:MAG TPA: 2,3,4,5-tetrahydropyridine-2,6-dicarboxylate N-succinyltransferase [Bacteroidota bacterium]|nr:2,3,4,5-tetrahydropyridine-2,6-dicarboxylate N-succinyltransferase [Bacteroidota bacterium]